MFSYSISQAELVMNVLERIVSNTILRRQLQRRAGIGYLSHPALTLVYVFLRSGESRLRQSQPRAILRATILPIAMWALVSIPIPTSMPLPSGRVHEFRPGEARVGYHDTLSLVSVVRVLSGRPYTLTRPVGQSFSSNVSSEPDQWNRVTGKADYSPFHLISITRVEGELFENQQTIHPVNQNVSRDRCRC